MSAVHDSPGRGDGPRVSLEGEALARYARHLTLPGVGIEGQERLAGARVLVIGMGGLGSPVALYLAAAGVGTLGLCDFDTVAAHNLQRQILHDDARIGERKTASAEARLRALNPTLTLCRHDAGITADNALDLFTGYDLIVDGSDNFGTRYLVNDAAVLARKPLVYGSIFQFEGQVSFFAPHAGGPCYRCLFPEMPAPDAVPNCAEAGVFGALCGVVGSLQAMEAIKWLTGVGENLLGRLQVIDALGSQMRTLRLARDPGCPVCGESPAITALDATRYDFACATPDAPTMTTPANESPELPTELDVQACKALLDDESGAVLLDVREPFEFAIARIDGAREVPMRTVPEHLDGLPRNEPVVVMCHHGARSLRVTKYLRERGFARAVNMKGGIDAWSREIDPSLPRY